MTVFGVWLLRLPILHFARSTEFMAATDPAAKACKVCHGFGKAFEKSQHEHQKHTVCPLVSPTDS
jgi:hypothetical protein